MIHTRFRTSFSIVTLFVGLIFCPTEGFSKPGKVYLINGCKLRRVQLEKGDSLKLILQDKSKQNRKWRSVQNLLGKKEGGDRVLFQIPAHEIEANLNFLGTSRFLFLLEGPKRYELFDVCKISIVTKDY